MRGVRGRFHVVSFGRKENLHRRLRDHYESEVDEEWFRSARERIRGRVLPSMQAPAGRASMYVRVPQWVRTLALVVVAVVGATSASFALNSVVNLGKPTNAVPSGSFPLSGFQRVGKPLKQGQKVAVLVISTQFEKDLKSATERWPMVKALDQFGSFSDVRPLERICRDARGTHIPVCTIASFDWTRARYTSRYVSFLHADVLRSNGSSFQPLYGALASLYDRYSRLPGFAPGDRLNAKASVANVTTTHTLPLVAAGGYVQTVSQALAVGDFQGTINVPANPSEPTSPGMATPTGLSFDVVHGILFSGKAPKYNDLVYAVNAEANILVGLICHADGMRPSGVCGRPAIQEIVKRLH